MNLGLFHPLCPAVHDGDVRKVERLVGQNPGLLNAKGVGELTPLTWACYEGLEGMARCLLEMGADVNLEGFGGSTPLYIACHYGNLPVARLLVEHRADLIVPGDWYRSPFSAAFGGGRIEVVRVLLGHPSIETIINQRNEHGWTPLWWACLLGLGEVARALLESGADPMIADISGCTLLAMASRDIDEIDTVLHVSAEGRRECVSALKVGCSHHPFFLKHRS
jgi:ankyrin repeat protein